MVNALKKSNPQVEDANDVFYYCDASCAICHGGTNSEAICHLYVGSIGEAVRWAKGDPHCRFEVREMQG